jgi:translation elongation factor EF-G
VKEHGGSGSSEMSCKWVSTPPSQTATSFDLTFRNGPEQYTQEAINLFFDHIDGVVVVFNARHGVDFKLRRALLRPLRRYKMPTIVLASVMDTFSASSLGVVNLIHSTLVEMPTRAVPTQLLVGAGGNFDGVVDIVGMRLSSLMSGSNASDGSETRLSEDMFALAKEWRVKLEKTATASDDELARICHGGEAPSTTQLIGAIRRATMSQSIMPIVIGPKTTSGLGIEALLSAVCDYFPSPTEAAPKPGPERISLFFLVAKLTAANVNDTEKLLECATELARDGSFYPVAVESDAIAGAINIKGADLLQNHIQELIEELRRTSTLDFSAGPTGIFYYETLRFSVQDVEETLEFDHHHARVVVTIDLCTPEGECNNAHDPDIRFENDAKHSTPKPFIPACENALRKACEAGCPLKGSPITRLGMRLRHGSHRGDDYLTTSHFSQATAAALRAAFSQFEFVPLEPVMRVEVEVPDEYAGAVCGALLRKRRGSSRALLADTKGR